MTDRHAGYVVTLAEDIREDDAEYVINAMRMIKGVVTVTPVVSDFSTNVLIAGQRSDDAWRLALLDLAKRGPVSG